MHEFRTLHQYYISWVNDCHPLLTLYLSSRSCFVAHVSRVK